jgi:DNA-binding MarR family transcriptional regulator
MGRLPSFGLLVRRIRADTPPGLQEFSWTQKAVLSRLEKHGPATAADLARAEGVKPQSMGTALGLLEKMGLVERKAHPSDGRQIKPKRHDSLPPKYKKE